MARTPLQVSNVLCKRLREHYGVMTRGGSQLRDDRGFNGDWRTILELFTGQLEMAVDVTARGDTVVYRLYFGKGATSVRCSIWDDSDDLELDESFDDAVQHLSRCYFHDSGITFARLVPCRMDTASIHAVADVIVRFGIIAQATIAKCEEQRQMLAKAARL